MKKIISVLFLFCSIACAYSQEKTALQVVNLALKEDSPNDAVILIQNEIKNITVLAEKRSLFAFLGSLQETLSMFDDARQSYATAAGIGAKDAEGMKKKSSEELVIDAVRCALSGGQADLAVQYLNSSVRNSKNENIQAQIKLYEQWAALSKAESVKETEEAITFLKVYSTLDSMKSVKKSILLTLWYMTDSKEYASALVKEYPNSLEAGVVLGKVMVMPAPFWYFVPREKVAQNIEVAPVKVENNTTQQQKTTQSKTETSTQSPKTEEKYEVAKKMQLGLFRDKENALAYVEKVGKKGFKPYIQEEKRASGTVYYIVVVDENPQGTIGTELKTAGFECYPLF
jgi:hypothetical protein